tara:strand:- start:1253 stop:1561 length:309 start_codon:yes stop_codon:yes gene_type:complete
MYLSFDIFRIIISYSNFIDLRIKYKCINKLNDKFINNFQEKYNKIKKYICVHNEFIYQYIIINNKKSYRISRNYYYNSIEVIIYICDLSLSMYEYQVGSLII